MQNVHPMVVHFPLALLLAGVVLDVIGLLTKNKNLRAAGACNLALGTVGAAVAVGTGLWAEESVSHTEAAHLVMTTHETLGLSTLAAAIIIILWRWRAAWPAAPLGKAAYTAMGVLLAGLLISTGYWGGRLVFEHGVAVAPGILAHSQEQSHHHHEGEEAAEPARGAPAPGGAPQPAAAPRQSEHQEHEHRDHSH